MLGRTPDAATSPITGVAPYHTSPAPRLDVKAGCETYPEMLETVWETETVALGGRVHSTLLVEPLLVVPIPRTSTPTASVHERLDNPTELESVSTSSPTPGLPICSCGGPEDTGAGDSQTKRVAYAQRDELVGLLAV